MSEHTLGGIALPSGMVWEDEMQWQANEVAADRGIHGALILDVFVKTAGRPITLVASETSGWKGMTRAKVLALKALADAAPTDPITPIAFTHADGRVFSVVFAPVETPIDARPLARPELPEADYPYIATVRLITLT